MAHPDASIRTTKKSVVIELIEKETQGVNPPYIDTVVVDGIFILQILEKQLPHNLRGLVRVILMKVMKLSQQRVDLVFDTYNSPSLKDIKRDERGDTESVDVYSFGPGQKTPHNFHELLRLSSFKKSFLRYFYVEIRNQEYACIIKDRILYCSVDNECTMLSCDEDGILSHETVLELYGNHDEADTRIAFHIYHASQNGSENIIVRCNDTDILVILLANCQYFSGSHVWMDVGFDSDNSRRYININNACENINFVSSLVGVYAISGCDYIPAFHRKGKKKAIKLLRENSQFIDAFSRLGEVEITDDDEKTIECFICSLFGSKQTDINQARCLYFDSKCKPRTSSRPLDYIKSIEPSLFPPCRTVIQQQIKRAWFVARLYKRAHSDDPVDGLTPLDYGWQLHNGKLEIKWFEGDQLPNQLEEIHYDVENDEDDSDEEIDEDEDEDDNIDD